jgi:hypothetical protein
MHILQVYSSVLYILNKKLLMNFIEFGGRGAPEFLPIQDLLPLGSLLSPLSLQVESDIA